MLKRLSSLASEVRSIIVNLLLLGLVVAIGCAFVWELSKDTVVVEPISTPRDLAQRGYSDEIVARRLIDELAQIREKASTRKNDIDPVVLPDSSQLDLHIPGAPMSFSSIVRFVKETFGVAGLEISGEINLDGDQLHLRLRDQRSGRFEDVGIANAEDVDGLVRHGARALMKMIDPYVLASYLKDFDTAAAMEIITYCLVHQPTEDDPWAYNLWGQILRDQGHYQMALEKYDQAIELQSDFVLAYSNGALALTRLERYDEAEARHQKAARIDPDDPHVYSSWGESLKLQDKPDQAIEKFKIAIRKKPDNAYAYNEWGRLLKDQGDTPGAVAQFRQVARLLPDNKVAHNNLGNELRLIGRLEESEMHLKKALQLDDRYGFAYYNLGLLYEKLDRPRNALACYQAALQTELKAEWKRTIEQDQARLQRSIRPAGEASCP